MLVDSGLVGAADLKGCSEMELAELEKRHGGSLPLAYKTFLLALGCEAGGFMEGTDFLFRNLTSLRHEALNLLKECNADLELGPRDFVFAAHQGYQFLYFNSEESENPGVFYYLDGEETSEKIASSFTEWFAQVVEDEVENKAHR